MTFLKILLQFLILSIDDFLDIITPVPDIERT